MCLCALDKLSSDRRTKISIYWAPDGAINKYNSQKDVSREQKRGSTNIEAIKYFYEKWKTNNSKYSTILEAEDESRVCQTCHQIWIGNSLEADCPKCNKPTIDTGPIGKSEMFFCSCFKYQSCNFYFKYSLPLNAR